MKRLLFCIMTAFLAAFVFCITPVSANSAAPLLVCRIEGKERAWVSTAALAANIMSLVIGGIVILLVL